MPTDLVKVGPIHRSVLKAFNQYCETNVLQAWVSLALMLTAWEIDFIEPALWLGAPTPMGEEQFIEEIAASLVERVDRCCASHRLDHNEFVSAGLVAITRWEPDKIFIDYLERFESIPERVWFQTAIYEWHLSRCKKDSKGCSHQAHKPF